MPYIVCNPTEKQRKKYWYTDFWKKGEKAGIPVIKILQDEPEKDSNLKIDGKFYHIRGIYYDLKNGSHLIEVREIEYVENPTFTVHDEFICPFCHLVHDSVFQNKVSLNSIKEGEKTCRGCGSEFDYECSVKEEYKITPKKKNDFVEITE